MIAQWNAIADTWLQTYFSMNIGNSLYILIALGLIYVFRQRSALFLRAIALLALLKLFIPPLPALPTIFGEMNVGLVGGRLPAITAATAAGEQSLTAAALLFLAWLLGIIALLTIIVRRQMHIRGLMAGAARISPKLPAGLVYPNVLIYRSQFRHSPFVCGFFKHRIVLPELSSQWTSEQLQMVIAHELAHIRYRDHWINLLQICAQLYYLFNPLVWLLNRQLNKSREITCDDAAVAMLRHQPDRYARGLLGIAETMVFSGPAIQTVIHFSDTPGHLKHRILHQLHQFKKGDIPPMKRILLSQIMVLAALALLILPLSCELGGNSANSTETINAPASGEAEVTDISSLDNKINVTGSVAPEYPPAAKDAGLEGRTVVDMLIATDGTVESVDIGQSSGHDLLDQAALSAAKQYRFDPMLKNGKSVKVRLKLPVKFKLPENDTR